MKMEAHLSLFISMITFFLGTCDCFTVLISSPKLRECHDYSMQYLNAVVHLAPKMQELLRIIAILYIKITNKIYSQASVLAFFFYF